MSTKIDNARKLDKCKKLENFLSSLNISDEEKELKRLMFARPFMYRILNHANFNYALVDSYCYSTQSIRALLDNYMISNKDRQRGTSDRLRMAYRELNDANILEAMKARSVFNDALNMVGGNLDSGIAVGFNKTHINENKYRVICYMRDHGVSHLFTSYFTDLPYPESENKSMVQRIYDGFEYQAFANEEGDDE